MPSLRPNVKGRGDPEVLWRGDGARAVHLLGLPVCAVRQADVDASAAPQVAEGPTGTVLMFGDPKYLNLWHKTGCCGDLDSQYAIDVIDQPSGRKWRVVKCRRVWRRCVVADMAEEIELLGILNGGSRE